MILGNFLEVLMVILVFISSDPFTTTTLLKVTKFFLTVTWIITIAAFSHRTFQNIQSLEYFMQFIISIAIIF
jgi:oligoendopeptidase F